MKSDLLRRAIGSIDDDLIEEAERKKLSPGRKRLYAGIGLAAACLALVTVGVFAPGGFRSRGSVSPEDPPAAQNDPVRTPEGEGPALDTLEPSASRIGENRDARPNADRETLLGYRIGGLYLGMPYTEAEKLLGKPKTASNSGPDLLPNGITRDSVSWNLSGTAARRNDLTIAIADAGDGFVVDEIDVWADADLSLPHGIRIGMTREELLEAWPELETDCIRYEGNAAENGVDYCAYEQYAGDELRFLIDLELDNGRFVVKYLTLGTFYKGPTLDEDAAEEPPYDFRFHGNPESRSFTLWRNSGGAWSETELKNPEAKRVEVQFGIEDLGACSGEPCVPVWFVDFHNGTVAGVFDRNEAGFVAKLEDPDAFARALENGESDLASFGLAKIEGCVFPAGVWDLLEALGK
ncbi:MAG: hypothetical protein IJM21_00255 [Clostridia bacterium]|nr:hypothetical protein [Clostridia bacterium]